MLAARAQHRARPRAQRGASLGRVGRRPVQDAKLDRARAAQALAERVQRVDLVAKIAVEGAMRHTGLDADRGGGHRPRLFALQQAFERVEQRFAGVAARLGGGRCARGGAGTAQVGPAVAELAGRRVALRAHPVAVGAAVDQLGDLVCHMW